MLKKINAAIQAAFDRRFVGIEEVAVLSSNGHFNAVTGMRSTPGVKTVVDVTSYVEMNDNGILHRYPMMVTMFDGVEYDSKKHSRKIWQRVARIVPNYLPGNISIIHIKGENFRYE